MVQEIVDLAMVVEELLLLPIKLLALWLIGQGHAGLGLAVCKAIADAFKAENVLIAEVGAWKNMLDRAIGLRVERDAAEAAKAAAAQKPVEAPAPAARPAMVGDDALVQAARTKARRRLVGALVLLLIGGVLTCLGIALFRPTGGAVQWDGHVISGVASKVPPSRLPASHTADTVTSMRVPLAAKGGRFAVTMTAAAFLVFSVELRVLTPIRSIMLSIDWRSMAQLRRLSPEPLRPKTTP